MTTSDLFVSDDASAIPIHQVAKGADLSFLDEAQQAFAAASRFKGATGSLLLLPDAAGKPGAVLFGVGEGEDPLATAALSAGLPPGTYRFAEAPANPEAAALGWALGTYRFDRYRSAPEEREAPPRLVVDGAVAERTDVLFGEVSRVRDLVNTPACDMGPDELEAAARALAEEHGAALEVVRGEALEQGFPMVHAVGRASTRAPRLIDLRWGDERAPKVTLVGKGVCYDTGGLNIKTGNYMRNMKKDMGGGAHVLGLAGLVMRLGLPVRLRVLVPAVENAVGGNAYRAGDVLHSRKGLFVEIGNTDAEGRLVLADALAYADEESPELLIDMATLTGAARVALGPDLPALYCDDEPLVGEILAAGKDESDPLWRMPLWANYQKRLESKVADVSHISDFAQAGSVTAALFLKRFVERAGAWVHIDVYAWVDHPRPGRPAGGEAQGIRALLAAIEGRYASR